MSDSKRITASKKDLLELEKGFWTGDAAYYEANVDTECLVAFPKMAQAMDNADLAKTATKPNRWRNLKMDLKGIIEPGSDIIMLTYEANRAVMAVTIDRDFSGWAESPSCQGGASAFK